MAGQTIPSFSTFIGAGASVFMSPPIPAGKQESVCLSAGVGSGVTVDLWVTVLAVHPTALPGGILLLANEPVRYRKPGGSPTLLQNFILPEGWQLKVQETSGLGGIQVTLYNRWRFDPLPGNLGLGVVAVVAAGTRTTITGPVPAGKALSVCLLAANGGVPDNYAQVVLVDPVNAPGGIGLIVEEPVRIKTPGGSPVLLQDFILNEGCSLDVTMSLAGTGVHFVAYNAWQFDA